MTKQLPNVPDHQDDFISIICHELKTPLTLLRAIMQLLDRKLVDTEDAGISASINKANEQIKKMGNLINSFLNVTFLETGKIHIKRDFFKLNHLIGEVVTEKRELTRHQFIVLDYCDLFDVYADRDKIGCVLSNILNNALKYSPEGKNIYVKCFKTPDKVIVRVRDEGAGIKPEHLERLFDRHFRGDNGLAQSVEGFGIGLYLCAAIIREHRGNIWAESEPGCGATFYFSLPLTNISYDAT